ncbi:MAG: magnesium/cobalt transporter CorA [Gemmatimonadetes bacterium]|nr:magnesium/cobalt transporter CorA [Gemmatimonadota bacterium]
MTADDAPGPTSYFLDSAGAVRRDLGRTALGEAVRGGKGPLWVDIDSRREEEWSLLAELFHFHPLAIEDTRSPDCRVKLEEYEDHLFVVMRGVRFATWTPAPYDIDPINLYLFLGPHYVVTVQAEPLESTRSVAERLEAAPEVLRRGVDYIAYMILDTLVDFYFPLLDQVDSFVDELEDDVFERSGERTMQGIFELKRTLLALRRQLAPMREVAASLANRPSRYLRPETQVYLRDVYDHVVRQLESVETFRDLVAGVMETHLSVMSNRMGQVMKSLSVVATLILPASLVAGIYGMNFEAMPGLHNPYGFWISMLAMFLVSGGLLYYMRRKGWL